MNLDNAVQTHAQWKTKLRSAISKHEQMDIATLSRDDCCELGQWLHGEGAKRFSQLASHKDCVQKHVMFHAEVTKVATAVNAKKFEQAESMLDAGSAYAQVSSSLSVAFLRLRKEGSV